MQNMNNHSSFGRFDHGLNQILINCGDMGKSLGIKIERMEGGNVWMQKEEEKSQKSYVPRLQNKRRDETDESEGHFSYYLFLFFIFQGDIKPLSSFSDIVGQLLSCRFDPNAPNVVGW